MQLRHVMLTMSAFWLAGAAARAQQPGAQAPAEAPGVIRTETRLVLVDTVVVDKKGTYVHDLTIKDFHVWEDNKEQSIKSFSFEADPNAPSNSQKRYLVLFFDNSTMEAGDQIRARDAAAKFIDSNAGPNRLMYPYCSKFHCRRRAAKAGGEGREVFGGRAQCPTGFDRFSDFGERRIGFRRTQRVAGPEEYGQEPRAGVGTQEPHHVHLGICTQR